MKATESKYERGSKRRGKLDHWKKDGVSLRFPAQPMAKSQEMARNGGEEAVKMSSKKGGKYFI